MNNRINAKLLFVISMLFCSIGYLSGQNENQKQPGFNKNAIYGNAGIGGLWFTATGYYERLITQNGKIASFCKAGAGYMAVWSKEDTYILSQFGILTGGKTHHLEVGAGAVYMTGFGEILPSATVGWRVQKPGGHFIFRMGASFPEAVYFGLGISF